MFSASLSRPSRQTAIVADKDGNLVVSHDVPLPQLQVDMVLIETVAVALNPVDVKLTGPMATEGAATGGDCSGVIVARGLGVSTERFALGDRVCAAISPMNPAAPYAGAFAHFAAAVTDCTLKIPSGMSFESAATLGIGTATHGAEKAFDYHDEEDANRIRAYTMNSLDFALDCICETSSMRFCYAALGRAGGRYTTLEPYLESMHIRKRVHPEWIMGPALLGIDIPWKEPYRVRASPELSAFGKDCFLCAQRLLDAGYLRPHPARVESARSLEVILTGLEELRSKHVSGEKLVYRIVHS